MDPAGTSMDAKVALGPRIVMPALEKKLDAAATQERHHIIIELNTRYHGTLAAARTRVRELVLEVAGSDDADPLRRDFAQSLHPFVFAYLRSSEIAELLRRDGLDAFQADAQTVAARANDVAQPRGPEKYVGDPVPHLSLRAIFKIWDSTPMGALSTVSIRTIKADAAQSAFAALGQGIVWAVLDSGIDASHPHFATYGNLQLDPPLAHKDFTPTANLNANTTASALQDPFGHGTSVAGILAGASGTLEAPKAAIQSVDRDGVSAAYHLRDVSAIRGMAPKCKLLSLRILDERGVGDVTAAINAMEYVMQLNAYGAQIAVHGINISAGYLPDVSAYGTGQTPLCVMVDRLVSSGVSVVVAAGNTGYVVTQSLQGSSTTPFEAAQLASINDPGNARLAITVGSTHREKPHTYGVSYFSSKGPTADGRLKPDLVAPGEKIISCAAGTSKARAAALLTAGTTATCAPDFGYVEDSGTSMAAPHVSGVLAAFLSVRPEYIGEAETLRDVVISSAVDLKRDARLQGSGLVDLMKMLQSV